METLVNAILNHLADAVREHTDLAQVTVGAPSPTETSTPRAAVLSDGLTFYPTDDEEAMHWIRLRARIVVRERRDDPALLVGQLEYLGQQVRQAVMIDPFRGGLCKHLPIGRATEPGSCELSHTARLPLGEIVLALRCHAETPEYPS